MKKKSITPWVLLLALPIPLLILNALIQFIVRFALSRTDGGGGGNIFVNIISLIIGIVAVLMLLGYPIWIIMLIKTYNDNKKIESPSKSTKK